MRRLLVNDALNQLGEVTIWNRLQEWFGCEFVGSDFAALEIVVETMLEQESKISSNLEKPSLIIRNATWFPPIKASIATIRELCDDCSGPMSRCGKHGAAGEPPIGPRYGIPTISLLQDIFIDGPQRQMQIAVIESSQAVVCNSPFTLSRYEWNVRPGLPNKKGELHPEPRTKIIPLPVDFSLFEPQNAMGCQQALGLPDGCVCWIGASRGAAGQVKGFDIFLQIVRTNPDIPFVAVFKDTMPDSMPPNLRCYVRLSHAELVKVIGACRVGLCTSRMESQHLAGIEMGACGLPLVVPPVGAYSNRTDIPGLVVDGAVITTNAIDAFIGGIRGALSQRWGAEEKIRNYWRKEFDIPVVRAAWEKLVAEVECSGAS